MLGTPLSYRNLFRQVRDGSEWNSYDDEAFLQALGAAGVDDDGKLHPTGAGLLMLGKDRWITDEYPTTSSTTGRRRVPPSAGPTASRASRATGRSTCTTSTTGSTTSSRQRSRFRSPWTRTCCAWTTRPRTRHDAHASARFCRFDRRRAVESGRNGLSGAKAEIVAALQASGEPLSSAEIAKAIGLGKTRTNELIGELITSGHVTAEGATRSRRYRIADK